MLLAIPNRTILATVNLYPAEGKKAVPKKLIVQFVQHCVLQSLEVCTNFAEINKEALHLSACSYRFTHSK